MTAPPWGHKPSAVPDVTTYWNVRPPEPSARCVYWLARRAAGSWAPNQILRSAGYHEKAEILGVWIWEVAHVPALTQRLEEQA